MLGVREKCSRCVNTTASEPIAHFSGMCFTVIPQASTAAAAAAGIHQSDEALSNLRIATEATSARPSGASIHHCDHTAGIK